MCRLCTQCTALLEMVAQTKHLDARFSKVVFNMMEIPEEIQEAADAADAVQGTLLGQLALPLSRITLNK